MLRNPLGRRVRVQRWHETTLVPSVSPKRLAEPWQRHQVQGVALFGSALTRGFQEHSDVDLLVAFRPGARIGFLTLARMRRELEEMLGRKVDLVPKGGSLCSLSAPGGATIGEAVSLLPRSFSDRYPEIPW